jgi:hypothetical protein
MGFTTVAFGVDKTLVVIAAHPLDGAVVAASKEEYFGGLPKRSDIKSVEAKDDGVTFFFTLNNGDFVEYKLQPYRGGLAEDEDVEYKHMTGIRLNGKFNQSGYECSIRSELTGKLISRQWAYTKEEALAKANRNRY